MSKKKIVIIGAGIAGLSAGCYLQMNGYDTEIFEAHSLAGGLCTAWRRKGYTIEGCIHGLLGSSPTHPLYKLWDELIDMSRIKFIDSDIKHFYNFGHGKQFVEYADLDKLESSMKKTAPEDKDVIEEFIKDIRRFQSIKMSYDKPKEFLDLPGKLKMLKAIPLLSVIKKWMKVSAEDFSNRFKNPLLQEVVKHFSSPILFEMFVLSEMDLKRCGYPAMGSLQFAGLFEKKYLSCGGKINYNNKVSKVIVADDKAIGILLENEEQHFADIVISAADGRTTIYSMLEGKYVNKKLNDEYRYGELNPSKIQVSLGVDGTFTDMARTIKLPLSSPLKIIDGNEYDAIDVLVYNNISELSPENKTLMVVQLDTKNGEYWVALKNRDKGKYQDEKKTIADNIIDILDSRIGNIQGNIDMVDIATPATYIRYTGNWNGSVQGWANENIFKTNPFKKELPGLKSFYMIGQWVEPGGGVPNAFKSGRDVAQIICREDRIKFNTV